MKAAFHITGNLFALLLHDLQTFDYAVEFGLVDFLLYLRGLPDFSKLFVREDDGCSVVVFHFVEQPFAFSLGKIVLAGNQ